MARHVLSTSAGLQVSDKYQKILCWFSLVSLQEALIMILANSKCFHQPVLAHSPISTFDIKSLQSMIGKIVNL